MKRFRKTLAFGLIVIALASFHINSVPLALGDDSARTISHRVGKLLKAAQDDLSSGDYASALSELQQADDPPNNTSYERHLIHELEGYAYVRTRQYDLAARALEPGLTDGFLDPAQTPQRVIALAQLFYQIHNYDKAIEYGEEAIENGYADAQNQMPVLVGQAYYLGGNFAGAAQFEQRQIAAETSAGKTPANASLQLWLSACKKLNNAECQGRANSVVMRYYPGFAQNQESIANAPSTAAAPAQTSETIASSTASQSDGNESPAEWEQEHEANIDDLKQQIAAHEEQAQQDDANAEQADAQVQADASANPSGPGAGWLAIGHLVQGAANAGLAVKMRQDAADERQAAQEEREQLAELGAEQPPVAENDSASIALTRTQTQMIRSGNTIQGALERNEDNLQGAQQSAPQAPQPERQALASTNSVSSSSSQPDAASSIPRYIFAQPANQCLKATYVPTLDPSYWVQNTCSVAVHYDWATPTGKWGTGEGLGPGEKSATIAPPVQYFACSDPYWPSPVQATPSDGDPVPYNGQFECVTANPAWLKAQ